MNYNFYGLAKILWPINRSLTGKGNRLTLRILKKINPKLKLKKVKSNTKVSDWIIPLEWNVKEAFIKNIKDEKILDFKKNNLHLMGYSTPFEGKLSFNELKKKIRFIKSKPNTIPYTTSYYKKNWSFNMTYNNFKKMKKNEDYFIKIDSELTKGVMNYGEIYIPGKLKKEVMFSTYICHPSMANNELSGPVVSIFLSDWLSKRKNNYSYRFIFIPETIGSIYYISKNLTHLKKRVLSIFNVNCVGDTKKTSLLSTKYGDLSIDKLVQNILNKNKIKFKQYYWKDRGSDERQYMSPGIDIPTISLMASKFREYSEYHTSDDNLDFISQKGLKKSYNLYKKIIIELDKSIFPKAKYLCEPNLGKRNLYPKTNDFSHLKSNKVKIFSKLILSFLSYSDGKNSIEDIAKYINLDYKATLKIYKLLKKNNLIKKNEKHL